jgi:hypothetical protein
MPKRLTLGTSNLNLSTRRLLGGMQGYIDFLDQAGYDAYQLMPVHGKTGLYRRLARADKAMTLQESWVLPRGIQKGPGFLKALAIAAVFPAMDASHQNIKLIRGAARGRIPNTLIHPLGQALGNTQLTNRKTPSIIEPTWQLTSELLESWGLNIDVDESKVDRLADKIKKAAIARRLGKVVIDTNHATATMQESKRRPIPNIVKLAGALATNEMVDQVEISLRPDFGGAKGDIHRVSEGGLADTIHGKILQSVAQNMPPGEDLRVVTEVRASSVAKDLPGVSLINFHKSLTDQIHHIVDPHLPQTASSIP